MESLSYTCEESRLPFTDDIELSVDGLVRSRNLFKGWDAETLPVPMKDMFEGLGFVESGLPEMTRMPVLSTQCLENSLEDDANCDSGKSVPSTSTITLNSSLEFGTRFSCSAFKTNDEKLVPASLKIEKLESPKELKGNSVSVEDSVVPSQGPSASAKRARIANFQSRIPVCIVHGCNKDLSSSKEYHKKHKVCDVHSKTAVVIVNGVHQRFCQQCSRFHILAEFDDGKRSCRKRLAGHNERRRKPQLNTHLDSSFYGTDMSSTSLLFSKNLPGGFFSQLHNEPTKLSTQITAPLKFGCSLPKSPFHLNETRKQYPPKNCPNSPLSVLELSAGSNSSCALSLLSAQSLSSLSNSAGISMDYPLNFEEYHHSNLAFNQNPTKFRGIFSSSSGEADQGVLDASVSAGFGTPTNELSQQSSNTLDVKHYPSPEGGNTVDLLQLSLHLQRVEHQKQCDQIKLENGIFCHPDTT